MIVADTSLIGHAVLRGQLTTLAMRCHARDPEWVSPAVWRFELVSVFAKHFRRPEPTLRISLSDALFARAVALSMVRTSEIELPGDVVLRRAFDLRIGGYDAHYVVLAERLGVRVVTADRQLLERAASVCVSLEDFAAGR